MSARSPASGQRPPLRPKGKKPLPVAHNPQLYAQMRKILSKHYRTKYGVRQRLRGRKP